MNDDKMRLDLFRFMKTSHHHSDFTCPLFELITIDSRILDLILGLNCFALPHHHQKFFENNWISLHDTWYDKIKCWRRTKREIIFSFIFVFIIVVPSSLITGGVRVIIWFNRTLYRLLEILNFRGVFLKKREQGGFHGFWL